MKSGTGDRPANVERRRRTALREVLQELLELVRDLAQRSHEMAPSELEFAQERLEWLADEVWRTAVELGGPDLE